MKPSSSTTPNLSASAHLVALYRALESERPDALFEDPYARRLAGTLGVALAQVMGNLYHTSNSIAVRTYLIDAMILDLLASDPVDIIINLGAGLDTRPYRLSLPSSLCWIEVDLPELLSYKEKQLNDIEPVCRVERVTLDLHDIEQRRSLFETLNIGSQRILILAEGLLGYFRPEQVVTLAQDLHRYPNFQWWLFELISLPAEHQLPQSRSLFRQVDRHFGAGQPAFQFLPEEGTQFFYPYGWRVAESRSILDEMEQLNRATFLARLWKSLSRWIYKETWQTFRQQASIVLMERTD
ncbi:MAG: SAM-dependent methyltransferase [Thermosynechococcaceae cyanobacterium]